MFVHRENLDAKKLEILKVIFHTKFSGQGTGPLGCCVPRGHVMTQHTVGFDRCISKERLNECTDNSSEGLSSFSQGRF